ncbi:MAG: hypothetical protein QXP36_03565, partial [Conexivisphaerales archaeon]
TCFFFDIIDYFHDRRCPLFEPAERLASTQFNLLKTFLLIWVYMGKRPLQWFDHNWLFVFQNNP